MIGILLERFLIGGMLAWVAAIVLGVGAHFGLWAWRRHWTLAGALAGAGTFALYVSAASMTASMMQLTGGLFVGCGIALAYGTLFLRPGSYHPALGRGTVEEKIRLRDTIDALRPQLLDWGFTAALAVPGFGLVWTGVTRLFTVTPVVVGLVSLLGPLAAGVGLAVRHRVANKLLARLEGPAEPERLSSASPPSSSLPVPTRTD